MRTPGYVTSVAVLLAALLVSGIQPVHADDGIQLGGFVQMNAIRDFGAVGNPDEFTTRTIPASGTPQANLTDLINYSLRPSRISLSKGLDTHRGRFNVFLSMDFFGGSSSKPEPRLRKAYGTVGGLLVGQDDTAFSDPSSWTNSLDFEGPNARVLVRQGVLRWTFRNEQPTEIAVSVEQPHTDIAVQSSDLVAQSDVPDLVGRIRHKKDRGHIQVAAVVSNFRVINEPTGAEVRDTGWGVSMAARLKVRKRDSIRVEGVYGDGAGAYIQDLETTGSGALADTTGGMTTITSYGGYGAYELGFAERWVANFIYGYVNVDNIDLQPGSAYKETQYVAVNIIWTLVSKMNLGAEFLWGERTNKDGSSGDASRFMLSGIVHLN